jgi:hypothetical protein
MTPPLFTHPLSIFVLVHSNMDSSHNLRKIHEGRTIVTILVSAARQYSGSGKCLPGPAVPYMIPPYHTYDSCVFVLRMNDTVPCFSSSRFSAAAAGGGEEGPPPYYTMVASKFFITQTTSSHSPPCSTRAMPAQLLRRGSPASYFLSS